MRYLVSALVALVPMVIGYGVWQFFAAPNKTDAGWIAPNDGQLIEMIKSGFVGGVNAPEGYQSDMPGFEAVLTDEQIALILGYIKSTWPKRGLEAQKEITLKK